VFKELDSLLRVYYDSFLSMLNDLSVASIRAESHKTLSSFDNFLEGFRKYEAYGFQLAMCCLPVTILDEQDYQTGHVSTADAGEADVLEAIDTYAKMALEMPDDEPRKIGVFERILAYSMRGMTKGIC
jgi:hypothetical protein